MNAEVYFRVFSKNAERQNSDDVVRFVSVTVPAGTSMMDIIRAAAQVSGKALDRRNGMVGVFEVQTDEGIFSHPEGKCVLTRGTEFKTWEQLDNEE